MAHGANTTLRASFVAAAVVVAVLLLASAVQAAADLGAEVGDAPPPPTVEHTVRTGDNLWTIAEAHTPHGQDVRMTIDAIRRLNRLETSTIHAGQVLFIPAE